jgi:aspartokinase/homoserine dehydrogenase 1
LEKEENYFVQLYNKAKLTGAKLKFVSVFERGEYEDKKVIELLRVNSKHPLYNVDGTNNSILIYTERYGKTPLVITGAGAGKEVTAMAVFANIINIAK